jgi:hypothetical protein
VNQGGTSKKMTRQQVHTLEAGERVTLPAGDVPTAPPVRFGDGDTGFYEPTDDELRLALATVFAWAWLSARFEAAEAAGPAMMNEAATATNPTLVPNKADPDSGLGWSAADRLALVAGGLEAIGAEDPADLVASETSLWLFDFDSAAVVQVSVGADDSGGAGFKVLRIAN